MPSKPTHILYIAEFSTGGSVESLLCLAGGLNKSEYEASVLFFTMPAERVVKRFETTGAKVHSLYPRANAQGGPSDIRKRNMQSRVRNLFGRRIERFYESLKYAIHFLRFRFPIYKALRKKIEELQPDLIHLNNGVRSDTPGILAARRSGIPTICHVRTFSKLTYLNVAAARSIETFVCISNAVRDTLVDYGIRNDRCVVVPNAVDPEQFRASGRSSIDIRNEFGFDGSHYVFALVGRVVSWKGHDYFIEAIAEANKTKNMIKGLIVGDAEPSGKNDAYMNILLSQVNSLGLEDVVKFSGHRTDIPDIMKSSDVVVCASSLPEPFGRVIIESMAAGTVVIATDAGGAPDIIENDVNGLLVPVKNSHALAQAMLRLCEEPQLSKRLRSAAADIVQERYTVGTHVDRICDIYRSAINDKLTE